MIYYRVTDAVGLVTPGRVDLKTLKGAAAHVRRTHPAWHEVEVSIHPFPENFSPPNHREFRLANRRNTLKEVRPMTRNAARIANALVALEQYRQEDPNAEPSQFLWDLMSDLRHWAAVNNVNFDRAVAVSADHFQQER